jgi:pimeloyl-ACP methyl ester carboxylesterase
VLRSLDVTGPLVLVGHSLGGIYLRAYAALHMASVAGMVLVDSSHERQLPVLRAQYTGWDKVLVAMTVPQLILRSSQWRGGADRRSAVREYRMFKRLGASDQALTHGELGDRPLIVVTRGPGGKGRPSALWRAWCDLQRDLVRLSANSRHLISESPDHYLNEGDPKLLVSSIAEVVRSARTGDPLQEPVMVSEGE